MISAVLHVPRHCFLQRCGPGVAICTKCLLWPWPQKLPHGDKRHLRDELPGPAMSPDRSSGMRGTLERPVPPATPKHTISLSHNCQGHPGTQMSLLGWCSVSINCFWFKGPIYYNYPFCAPRITLVTLHSHLLPTASPKSWATDALSKQSSQQRCLVGQEKMECTCSTSWQRAICFCITPVWETPATLSPCL